MSEIRNDTDEPHELNYAPARTGHSPFGIASMSVAIAVFLFVIVSSTEFLDRSPFQSMGNEKEMRVSCLAAFLGLALGIRAMADPARKQILGVLGICLNPLVAFAALIFLPFI